MPEWYREIERFARFVVPIFGELAEVAGAEGQAFVLIDQAEAYVARLVRLQVVAGEGRCRPVPRDSGTDRAADLFADLVRAVRAAGIEIDVVQAAAHRAIGRASCRERVCQEV